MIAYKNCPRSGKEKMYQERNYQLRPSAIGVSVSNTTLDRLARTPAINEFYQRVSKTYGRTNLGNEYDLSQPIWFYMIMKKLAAERKK